MNGWPELLVARARRCAHRPLALFLSLTSVVSAVVEGAGVEARLRSQHDKLRGNAQYLQVLYWRFAGALLVQKVLALRAQKLGIPYEKLRSNAQYLQVLYWRFTGPSG